MTSFEDLGETDDSVTEAQYDEAVAFFQELTKANDEIYMILLRLSGISPKPPVPDIQEHIGIMLENVFEDARAYASEIKASYQDPYDPAYTGSLPVNLYAGR